MPASYSACFSDCNKEADFQGTAVGLATVRRILQKHGGRIWAEAKPDQGKTFYFTCEDAHASKEKQVAVGVAL